MLGLYVHVPFCSAICNYCNFNRGLFDADLKVRYVDALIAEIQNARLKPCATDDVDAVAGPDVAHGFSRASARTAEAVRYSSIGEPLRYTRNVVRTPSPPPRVPRPCE